MLEIVWQAVLGGRGRLHERATGPAGTGETKPLVDLDELHIHEVNLRPSIGIIRTVVGTLLFELGACSRGCQSDVATNAS
jgi:hypothetical protein